MSIFQVFDDAFCNRIHPKMLDFKYSGTVYTLAWGPSCYAEEAAPATDKVF